MNRRDDRSALKMSDYKPPTESFSLDDEEYDRLEEERNQIIDDANKKYGYGNGISSGEKKEKKKAQYVQKYHDSESLAEAVIVAGISYFAACKIVNDESKVDLISSIPLTDTTELRPYEVTSYMNKPYTFKSKDEFENIVQKAKTETLDSLYEKVKRIWTKYVDADDFHISMCTADTIYTYFQDKIGLTHYLFFVGNNASGKSNNLTVFHFLAYRNFTSTDMTAANIYQFLGSMEEGQGTLCEDEADRIDEDREKMAIYKNGNITGRPVARTDTSFGRKQLKLNTYCFKAFAAERLPDAVKAKGFNQRIIELPCLYGFPQYDISEVANPAGEEEYQSLLDELNETRNLLLMYRLLHFNDKIPNIKLNIENREKQLFKPVLRIFQDTEKLKELLPIVSKYVSQKREGNTNTLYAFLYRTITDLIKAQDTTELESSLIWNYITEILPGEEIPHKQLSYESSEFGTISQKGIIEIFMQVFGAKRSLNRREKRKLLFDMDKLQRLGKVYNLSMEIKVGPSVTDVTDVTDIGLDRHLIDHPPEIEIIESKAERDDFFKEEAVGDTKFTNEERQVNRLSSVHPSQVSHLSPIKEVGVENRGTI